MTSDTTFFIRCAERIAQSSGLLIAALEGIEAALAEMGFFGDGA